MSRFYGSSRMDSQPGSFSTNLCLLASQSVAQLYDPSHYSQLCASDHQKLNQFYDQKQEAGFP